MMYNAPSRKAKTSIRRSTWQKKQSGSECDAKACYNCILPIVLLLAYVKLGLPYITTTYLMARAADGPPGWGAIIDIVLKVYAKSANGCTIKHTEKQGVDSLKTNADAFVDNATLLHSNDQFNASAHIFMAQ
eukprot:10679010-Ditylum_brightwellii.AAC.1